MGRRKRPKLSTKEELIAYLEANKDTELPFNEVVWDIAVEKTAEKERQFKEIQTTDFDGNTKVKKIPNGSVNPVGKYFQLMALPQYQNPVSFDDFTEDDIGDIEEDLDIDFGDEEKADTVNNWISVFFNGYSAQDKKFLKERLGDYYDNYEINEGADKLIVIKAVADELEMMNLTKQRAKNKDNEARLEKVQKGYLSLLESLKALKKQRGAMEDEGKNKLTIWIEKLNKEKGFKASKVAYDQDQIDKMLETFTNNIIEVWRNG